MRLVGAELFIAERGRDIQYIYIYIYIHTYILTYLLTYSPTHSMQHSPNLEANRFSASQEIPCIGMEPKGSLPHSQVPDTCPYPELARASPYPTSHFLKIHLNIILPSTHGSPQWYLSLRFPHQNPIHASLLPHRRHMPRPYIYIYICVCVCVCVDKTKLIVALRSLTDAHNNHRKCSWSFEMATF